MKKNKLMGHLKKTISNMDSRPVLQCANYNENGNLYATNSHVAIKVADFHVNQSSFNLNLFTLEINDIFYPDIEKNFIMSDIVAEINVDINILTKALKPFVDRTAMINNVNLDIRNKAMVITSNSLPDFKIEVPLHDCEGELEICCDPHYLINGLAFIKDAKANKKDTDNRLALIQFQNRVRPFKINLEDEYEYLITPIRNFN